MSDNGDNISNDQGNGSAGGQSHDGAGAGNVDTPVPSLISDDLTFADGWQKRLSDESLHDDPTLATVKDLNGLSKALVDNKKMIGADKIVKPNEASDESTWNNYYSAIGRPEASDGYGIKDIAGEDLMSDDQLKEIESRFHKVGAPTKVVHEAVAIYNDIIEKATAQAEEEARQVGIENSEALKRDWGLQFDRNLDLATRTMETLKVVDHLRSLGMQDDPVMMRIFHELGKSYGEDKMVGDPMKRVSPIDAREQIAAIENNPDTFDPESPNFKELNAKRTKLYAIASVA